MKNLIALVTASVLYALFFLCIDSKFATDFKEYLIENYV